MADVHPYLHLSPVWSAVFAHALPAAFLVLLAACVGKMLRGAIAVRRLAARAPDADLRPGRRAVLAGTVETDGEAPWTVDIRQRLAPSPHDAEELAWVETERSHSARPFWIAIAGGRSVRVEPDEAARLVGPELETAEASSHTRVRRARLDAGRTVFATGTLAIAHDPTASFRGGPAAVLRGPGLVVSTLSRRDQTIALRWAVVSGAVLVLAGANATFYGYFVRRFAGVRVRAEVTHLRVVQQRTDDGTNRRDMVRVQILADQPGAGTSFEEEVWESDHARLSLGMAIPVRWTERDRAGQLGAEPTIAAAAIAPPLVALVLALAAFVAGRRARSGWWEPPLVESAP